MVVAKATVSFHVVILSLHYMVDARPARRRDRAYYSIYEQKTIRTMRDDNYDSVQGVLWCSQTSEITETGIANPFHD